MGTKEFFYDNDLGDLYEWLGDLCTRYIVLPARRRYAFIEFYTERNKYRITAESSHGDMPGILLCAATVRKPDTGLDYSCNVSEVFSGAYSQESWRQMVSAILSNEMLKIWYHNDRLEVTEDYPKKVVHLAQWA